MAPEWLVTWWQYYHKDKRLCILIFKFKENVVGIAPWYLENRLGFRRLKTLGHGFIDYEGILIRQGMENVVMKSIQDWLLSNNTYDGAMFDRLIGRHWIEEQGRWNQAGMKVSRHPSTISLMTELTEGWEHFRSRLPKKFRSDTERQIRRLGALGDLDLRFIDSIEELDLNYKEFLKWKKERYDQRYRTNSDVYSSGGFWGDKNVAAYYRCVAEQLLIKKCLVFSCLRLNQKMISGIFGFEKDSTFFYFATAFYPVQSFSVGRIHLWLLLQNLCQRNIKYFDFLIGDDAYKRRWPVIINNLTRLKLYKSGVQHTLRRLLPELLEELEQSVMLRRIYGKMKLCIY